MYIRNMVEADVTAVQCLEQQTLSPWSLLSIREELNQKLGEMFVVEVEVGSDCPPEVVGWCAIRLIAPEAELLKIAVDQHSRRAGIATALLRHLTRFLSQRSIELLFLEVRSQNDSALSFYIKSGFLQIGLRTGYYSNPSDSALIYQKIL